MNNNINVDERVLAERRKIQSRGFAYIVYILLFAVFVQKFYMNAPFSQYAVEFFILIGCGFYNIVANFAKGIDIWNPSGAGKKEILITTIISGIASVIMYAFFTGEDDIEGLALYFAFFVVFFFWVRFIMGFLNKKKQEKINRQLDDEDI